MEATTTYAELLDGIEEFARELSARERLDLLHGLIDPLLDRLAEVDEEFTDEPALTSAEAVCEFRRAAAGESADVDAVYEHLTTMGLCLSEDQDEELHVLSQSAYAAATWLRLLTGRKLRASVFEGDEEGWLIPEFAPSPFTQVVDLLAWTRSDQAYLCWEDALDDPGLRDLPGALRELHAIRLQLMS